MSIESITDRIKNEAMAYSENRRAKAEAIKEETLENARHRAEKIKVERKIKAEEDAEVLISRRKSVAGLEVRKMKLSSKQDAIEECFECAMERLLKLDRDEYVALIRKQVDEFADEGGEIILNSADKEKLAGKLSEKLSDTKLVISDETAEIKGGCILKKGCISYNASFEKLLDNVRKELTAEVAAILFGDK